MNKFYLNQRLNYFQENNISLENTFLVATCVVTDRAKSKRIKEIKTHIDQGQKIMILGCGSLVQGEVMSKEKFFAYYPELLAYHKVIELLPESPFAENKDMLFHEKNANKIYTKHFLVIQNGCDNYCTFCLTVLKRGKSRNRNAENIIQEIKTVEEQGTQEIVITGINLAARGTSNTRNPEESQFSSLLKKIIKETNIPRIRISSIGPEYLDDEFFEIMENERFLPHFHFSIQSFSDRVLEKMRRNYDKKRVEEVLSKTRKLEKKRKNLISIGADIIVGFPYETENEFLQTYEGIEKYSITKLHAFPFSPHFKGETIPASAFPQISQEIKKEREQRLIQLGENIRNKFIQNNKGTSHQVLIEEHKNGKRKGRTENYIQVELEGEYKKGEIIQITL